MDATGVIQLLQIFYFLFVLFEITTCTIDVSMRVGKQGPFTYGNFHKRINGSVLRKVDSLVSLLEVDSDIQCANSCVMNTLCLSTNFGSEAANRTGKIQCELLNYGATDYQNHLVKKEKFFFMRMETICSKNPCVVDKLVCIPQLQDSYQPYICECPEECTSNIKCHALGMEDGRIPDSQITASSSYSSHWSSYKGRLNNAAGAWLTQPRPSEWLEVNLLNRTFIKAVATQGRHNVNEFTKTYQLSFSNNGSKWTMYKENGIVKTFQGNTFHATIVKNMLIEPFTAKIVRLLPKSWYVYPTIRMELYGCLV